MDELNFLQTMWNRKITRSRHLIVGSVYYEGTAGHFNGNEHWAFRVGYAFRDALDIQYTPRIVRGASTMVWTQGPILRFDVGDRLSTRDGTRSVTVTNALPMGWDAPKNEMYQGIVTFDEFIETESPPVKIGENIALTQMDFLRMLISGNSDFQHPPSTDLA